MSVKSTSNQQYYDTYDHLRQNKIICLDRISYDEKHNHRNPSDNCSDVVAHSFCKMSYLSLSVRLGSVFTLRFLFIRSRASLADPANSIPPTVIDLPLAEEDGVGDELGTGVGVACDTLLTSLAIVSDGVDNAERTSCFG